MSGIILTTLLLWSLLSLTNAVTYKCLPQPTCDECVQSHNQCAWCRELNFTKPGEPDSVRCDFGAKLRSRGCKEIVDPSSTLSIDQAHPLGEPLGVTEDTGRVQLSPQKVTLKLRPGQELGFRVRFRRAEGFPVDLYYLTDLSYSMKDDLQNIRKLGSTLMSTLHNFTNSVKIGFGIFVDKTTLPYISMLPHRLKNPCPDPTEQCQPAVAFRNVLPLTGGGAEEFQRRVEATEVSGNIDPPEGGLDALLQAAVCEREIGWRNVTSLLVYTSDAEFHVAGDGKLGGVLLPNDGRCHINGDGVYSESARYDYPSVGQLGQVLSQRNIQPIFAVTQNVKPLYQELSKFIPKSAVGELRADSSNVLQLISEAYNNLSSTIRLIHGALPSGVEVTITPHCQDPSPTVEGECRGVHINEEVEFAVRVGLSGCPEVGARFSLRAQGFTEKVEVLVDPLCHCKCGESPSVPRGDSVCSNGNGSLVCGQCRCNPGRVGKFCECSREEGGDSRDPHHACRHADGVDVCGGRGECVCEECVCHDKYHGRFCQCDDTDCVRHGNVMCAGHGRCACGTCMCHSDYMGEACECLRDRASCQDPRGGICGGHGVCKCDACVCEHGYTGKTCLECPSCPTTCQILAICAECLPSVTGLDCGEDCLNVTWEVQATIPSDNHRCTESGPRGNLVEFVIIETDSGKHLIVKEPAVHKSRGVMIVCGVMAGIVLLGLFLLVIARSIMEVKDRKEYHRFLVEKERAKWERGNPLYQSATTTILNPKYMPD